MHYEVELLVGYFHPPVWVTLSREGTGRARRFPNPGAAEAAARRCRQPGARRLVLVRDDGRREVVGSAAADERSSSPGGAGRGDVPGSGGAAGA